VISNLNAEMKGPVMKSAVAAIVAGLFLILPAAAEDAPQSPAPAPAPAQPSGEEATPVAPAATDDAVARDVRCFIVFMGLSAAPDIGQPAMQTGARMMAFYWYGKLSGQIPDAELERRLIAEGPKLQGDAVKQDLMRCSREVAARTSAMETILEHVGAAEEPAPDAAKPAPDSGKQPSEEAPEPEKAPEKTPSEKAP
jgi:hypothetical protein